MDANVLWEAAQALGPAAAVYAAIRADLARAMKTAEVAEQAANKAHERLDRLMASDAKGNG